MPSKPRTGAVARAALLITVVTLASRIVGFGRWLAQAQFLGTGGIDAPFNSANILPNVLFEVAAGGALAGAIVPLVAGPLSRAVETADNTDVAEARAQASQSASALLGWALAILIPLGLITALAAAPIARLLNLADPTMTDIATMFLRIFAVQIPIYGVAVVLGGVLQAHKRFFWPAFAPLVSSIVVIGVFAVFSALAQGNQGQVGALSSTALNLLAWGTTVGVAFLALPLLLPTRATGLRIRPTLKFPPGEGARARRLALAGIGALIAQQLSVLVIMRTANATAGPGAWTVYLYIQQVYLLPYAVLAFPIATSAFPHFTEHAAAGRQSELQSLIAVTTRTLILAIGAGVAALVAAASSIQDVFSVIATGQGVAGLAAGLTWMAPGLFGFALILHLSKALYAVDAGRAAVTATALGWIVVTVLAALLPAIMGGGDSWAATLGGLGLANSIGMTVAGIGLLIAVRRRIGPDAIRDIAKTFLIVAAGVLLGGGLGHWVTSLLPDAGALSGVAGIVRAIATGVLAGVLALAGVVAVSALDPALRAQLGTVINRRKRSRLSTG